jgi:hypothetical protein
MTKKRSPMELEGTRRIVEEDKLQKEKPLKKKVFFNELPGPPPLSQGLHMWISS